MVQAKPTRKGRIQQKVYTAAKEAFMWIFPQRAHEGQKTYSSPLMTWNGRNPFLGLFEELSDAWNYAVQAKLQWIFLRKTIRQTRIAFEKGRMDEVENGLQPLEHCLCQGKEDAVDHYQKRESSAGPFIDHHIRVALRNGSAYWKEQNET